MTSPAPTPEDEPLQREALEALRPGLELLALRAFGDRAAAEEVAQEVLARAAVAAERGTRVRRGHLAAFVAGIARHVIADRRAAVRRESPLADAAHVALAEPDALTRLLRAEEREQVRHALRALGNADRELLSLCFVDGLTPTEIAAQMNLTPEGVRKRKQRALDRLRVRLAAMVGHEGAPAPTIRVQSLLSPTEDVT